MNKYVVYGFSKNNVWGYVEVITTPECVEQRAHEKGITEITRIEGFYLPR